MSYTTTGLGLAEFYIEAKPGLPLVLRPYQLESCTKILEAWREYDRVLLVLPTAGGKTIAFSSVTRTRLGVGKVLVLAHRDELLDQAVAKLAANGVRSQKEKA